MAVKEYCEKFGEEKGIVITENQLIRKLELENADLKAALEKYGSHRRGCAAFYGHRTDCTCGLDAALKG